MRDRVLSHLCPRAPVEGICDRTSSPPQVPPLAAVPGFARRACASSQAAESRAPRYGTLRDRFSSRAGRSTVLRFVQERLFFRLFRILPWYPTHSPSRQFPSEFFFFPIFSRDRASDSLLERSSLVRLLDPKTFTRER